MLRFLFCCTLNISTQSFLSPPSDGFANQLRHTSINRMSHVAAGDFLRRHIYTKTSNPLRMTQFLFTTSLSLDRLPAEGCYVNVDAFSLLRKTRKSILFICEYFGATNDAVAVKMKNANCPFSASLFDSSIQMLLLLPFVTH
jgi:hypothetical protein